jgi:hypothetical protein
LIFHKNYSPYELLFFLSFFFVIPAGKSALAFAFAFLVVIPGGESAFAFAFAFLVVIPAGNLLFAPWQREPHPCPALRRDKQIPFD